MMKDAVFASIIAAALKEDIGRGDITSRLTVPANVQAEMKFIAAEPMVACGTFIAGMVFRQFKKKITVKAQVRDGRKIKKGTVLVTARGNARTLLAAERVILNFMQRLSGVATLTRRYAEAVKDTKAVILDTRKTMPGLRLLDKYAVRTGGGKNHRLRLDDMVLIKDNHIAVCGNIAGAVRRARAGTKLPIEVECDTLAQVKQAIVAGADRILLDNMSLKNLRAAVKLAAGKIPLEASGGMSLKNIRAVAKTGVDYISVGRLTHSAPAADISAEIRIRS